MIHKLNHKRESLFTWPLDPNGWIDEIKYTSNDERDAIEKARLDFDSHDAPYRVYVTNKCGKIIFYLEK